MLDLQQSRDAIVRDWDEFIRRLSDQPDLDWDTPVRCVGWVIRDLVAHVIWGMSLEADALARMAKGVSDPASGLTMDPSTSREELLQAVIENRDRLVEQLEQLTPEDLSQSAPMPYGPTPLPFALQVFVMEAGVHQNDLVDAMGQPEALPEDVSFATGVVLAGSLPVLAQASKLVPARGMTYRLVGENVAMDLAYQDDGWVVGSIEDTPDCQIRALDSDLILFAMGRIPADETRFTISGDSRLATDFKAYFPGP